jgi:uncharacterized NAD(P)/FAD-binding protein YdhS
MRLVRTEIKRAREQGVSWQAVIDALRPVTQELWVSLPPEERARFLRHLRRWMCIAIGYRRQSPAASTARSGSDN